MRGTLDRRHIPTLETVAHRQEQQGSLSQQHVCDIGTFPTTCRSRGSPGRRGVNVVLLSGTTLLENAGRRFDRDHQLERSTSPFSGIQRHRAPHEMGQGMTECELEVPGIGNPVARHYDFA